LVQEEVVWLVALLQVVSFVVVAFQEVSGLLWVQAILLAVYRGVVY
jgi:hypothetical protein